jgi:Holliday junction resolvase RusA-like endonuclease
MIRLQVHSIHAKGDPSYAWTPGQVYAPVKRYSANLHAYIEALQLAGKRAMHYEQRLMDGPVAIDITIAVRRPQSHYRADGKVKECQVCALPTQWPSTHLAARAVIEALEKVIYEDAVQVAKVDVCKVWRESAGTTVLIKEVNPREVDPELSDYPEQLELL